MVPSVTSVSSDGEHRFSKPGRAEITLVAGLGVRGDAHAGVTVQHRSRVARDPSQPNLRQVHLVQDELLAELRAQGFAVTPGGLGENVLTSGLDLLALPPGARLHVGDTAVLEVTGLRNPCAQIEAFRPGLLREVLVRGPGGGLVRRAGIMSVVLDGGVVRPGDAIGVEVPGGPHGPLEPV